MTIRILGAVLALFTSFVHASEKSWTPARTVKLQGLNVTLSEPVKVAESKGFLWFPTLVNLGDRRLLAMMSNKTDAHTNEQTGAIAWSSDGGLSWSSVQPVPIYSECPLQFSSETILLPNYLFPQREGTIGASFLTVAAKEPKVTLSKHPLTVTGFPRRLGNLGAIFGQPTVKATGFLFNGQCLRLKDGRQLGTLYGRYEESKRYDLIVAASKDGREWNYFGRVASEDCKLPGGEGPCEAALCRLKDGRIMCVFRMESGKPYGRSFSSDDGKTWTEPQSIDARSVQPSLVTTTDGTVVLSGGRPGVSAWFNVAGDGESWQRVELLADHEKTSAYTELVAMGESSILCIFDRIPHGWNAIPRESKDVNSIWVVRLTLEKTAN